MFHLSLEEATICEKTLGKLSVNYNEEINLFGKILGLKKDYIVAKSDSRVFVNSGLEWNLLEDTDKKEINVQRPFTGDLGFVTEYNGEKATESERLVSFVKSRSEYYGYGINYSAEKIK